MVEAAELLAFLQEKNYELVVGPDFKVNFLVSKPNNVLDCGPDEITFVNLKYADRFDELISRSKARIIIVESSFRDQLNSLNKSDKAFVLAADPKGVIYEMAPFFLVPSPTGIHPTALVSPGAVIGDNCTISAYAVIEDSVVLGNNCSVGCHTIIHSGVTIGSDVRIKACSVIGGSGFGYIKDQSGRYRHLPHFGRVVIEDDVEIGSNTCIDRGSLSDTIIRKGVKIDNLVHIAHNVELGENTLVIAQAMIAGSVKIGKNVWVAPSVSIRNGLEIGDDSTIGLGSVVTKNTKAGTTVYGVPAKEK